jgi:hypothetical protein
MITLLPSQVAERTAAYICLLHLPEKGKSEAACSFSGLSVSSSTETFKDRLARYRQIKLTVIGWKSGRTISIPARFVLEGEKLHFCL